MNLQIRSVRFTVRIRSHKCTFSYTINSWPDDHVFISKYRSREISIAVSDKTNILIIDDDKDILSACQVLLKRRFDEVVTCGEPRDIPSLMAAQDFHAIMLDMNFSPGASSGEEGLQWLGKILEIDRDAVVIMVTAFSSVDAAVEAMKLGAHDMKDWNMWSISIETLKKKTGTQSGFYCIMFTDKADLSLQMPGIMEFC